MTNIRRYTYPYVFLRCLLFSISVLPAIGHSGGEVPAPEPKGGICFIENNGQWNDTIRYKAEIGNGALFLTDQGFVYHFIHEEDLTAHHQVVCSQESNVDRPVDAKQQLFRHHAYKVKFVGANQGPMVFKGEQKRSWYNNYFIGNDSAKWQSRVGLYGRVTQQEVYQGIDMTIYREGQDLKYDFIVAPGADPSQIILEFEGVRPQLTKDRNLLIETSVNTIIEQAPIVYQKINGERKIIPSHYTLKNNRLSYTIQTSYDSSYPLIIDPTLVFATYSGGTGGQNWGFASAYDEEGNFYNGAEAYTVGWPVTTGAFQTSYAHYTDIGINKYNSDGGRLLFSTYIGGSLGDDRCRSLLFTKDSELVIAATTTSPDMPMLSNSFDRSFNGGWDIYIATLTRTGDELVAATYLGSVFNEGLASEQGAVGIHFYGAKSPLDIAVGNDNDIWVISNVELSDLQYPNSAYLPITPNAFQPIPKGGVTDILLARFNKTLSELLFCSYFGGSGVDFGTSIQITKLGDVLISGVTNSSDFPTTATAMHPNYLGGVCDGFVSVIDTQNYQLLHSTYVGTEKKDGVFCTQIDEQNNILVLGETLGDYPISSNVFNIPNSDVFIDKLSPDLSGSILSTRIGKAFSDDTRPSTGNFRVVSFLYDQCGRTYIGGYPNSKAMPTTADKLQNDSLGFWIGILERDFANLHYGTYFGTYADHPHGGITRFDPYGRIYQYVCTAADDYPTTANSAFPFKQNSDVDALAFKIDLEAEFVEAIGALPAGVNDTGCAPYTITFENNTYCPFPVEYTWDFGDGSSTDTNGRPTHTFTDPGVYQVVLKAYSAETCNLEDYDTLTVTVLSSEGPDVFTRDTVICSEKDRVKLWVGINNPSSDIYIDWSPEHAIEGPDNTDTVTVLPSEALTYSVKVGYRSNGCAVTENEIHIDYAPRGLDLLNTDTVLCKGDTLKIEAIGSEGYTYQWSPSIGVSDSLTLEPYIIATESHTYILTAAHPKCDDTIQGFVLTVDTPYRPIFSIEPSEVCVGQPVYFYPTSDVSSVGLNWTFFQQSRNEPQIGLEYRHAFDQTGSFPVTLEMAFRACPDTNYTDSVTVYPLPEVDLGSDSSICLHGAPIYLKNLREAPSKPHRYLWSTGDTTDVLTVVHPGTYTLSVIMEPIGCTTTESIEITKDCYIDIPNAFSPNDDGHNDYFLPRRLLSEGVVRFKMQVFNRWGQVLFETTNPEGRGWDGRYNGKPQPMGVYVYQMDVEFGDERTEIYNGNVTLLR